ncbi:alpha/beta hydrolase [Leifsonia sp. TF02-11]|uniref:esterase/lipase family protein n=1 Tax=Leifsonia sp. TF02-11 TaxID=2815212 RepID=UPI0027DE6F3A|nr:alpha/beta hydrolase [Leifsonia sp. TF02-11]
MQQRRVEARQGRVRRLQLLRRIGVLLADWEYVLRHQVRAAFDRGEPGALVDDSGTGEPVVLLPGIYETWRFLHPLARRLHAAGHPVHVVAALGDNRMSLQEAADRVQRHLLENHLGDVTIVAHSKGGLVARTLLARPETAARIRRVVAISTPFSGSVLAGWIPIPAVRALRPDGPDFARSATADVDVTRVVSIWGWYDPHIPGGCALAGARNIEVPVGGHFRILGSPRVLALVDELIDDAVGGGGAGES